MLPLLLLAANPAYLQLLVALRRRPSSVAEAGSKAGEWLGMEKKFANFGGSNNLPRGGATLRAPS